ELGGVRLPLRTQRALARRVAFTVVAAEGRGHLYAVTGERERIHEQSGYATIARGRAVRRRLKRCVKGDPHARLPDRTCAPGARSSLTARTRRVPAPRRRRRGPDGAPGRASRARAP